MAISTDVNFKGLTVESAYVQVQTPAIGGTKARMYFNVVYSADKDGEVFLSENLDCPYDIEGPNPFEQAYAYLKTLPEFEGATDC